MLWIPRIVLGFIGCQTCGRHLRRWRTALPRAGHDQIKAVHTEFLAGRPSLGSAGQQPAIINGDIALTSTWLPGGGATVEVARLQPDGTWRWVIDQPPVLP